MSLKHFQKIEDSDYVANVWIERDRAHLGLETPDGRTVFDLWDDDVHDEIEAGFLSTPRRPRPSESDWQPCLVAYARDKGLIN